MEAPSGWVFKGESFSVTCSTHPLYPGGSFQLRLIRPNGTVRHSLPALTSTVTFTFSNAHTQNEGYYCCQYKVQMGKRMLASRESQPLPISVRGKGILQWMIKCHAVVFGNVAILETQPSGMQYNQWMVYTPRFYLQLKNVTLLHG